MTTLIILNLIGWSLAALFLIAVVLTRRTNRHWVKVCDEKNEAIRELERQNLLGVEANPDGLKWYREENERLTRKCHAVCSQIRKMKGRGNVTMQMNPQHTF